MEVAVVVVAVLVLAAATVWHVAEEYRGKRIAVRRRVVVQLTDDRAMTGILWRRTRGLVVVRGAELVEPGRDPVPMDGEIVLERERIAWVQIVTEH
ncbi:MAG: hypothetical protein GEU83_11895 [Pseudonocardiaceae bacterium]|nr:hypothetical protein [Pseudonocardiaceae bacterium]